MLGNKRLKRRIKDDKGAANSISFMVIMFFIMTMLISFIDVGLYFNTKNQLSSAAESGARAVALYGGVNSPVRAARGSDVSPEDLVWNLVPENFRATDCSEESRASGTVAVCREDIRCHPRSGHIKVGSEVYCELDYTYNGIAGKFGLFKLGASALGEANSKTRVKGASVSEVTIN